MNKTSICKEALKEQIKSKDAIITMKDELIASKDQTINTKNQIIDLLNDQITELSTDLAFKKGFLNNRGIIEQFEIR